MRIITGKARGLKLTTPKNWDVRPTADRVKESLFNIIGSKIVGARVLDLFAGTGNLGLECWSRGAEHIVFMDMSRESLRLVQSNIAKCRAENETETLLGDAVQLIDRLYKKGARFDFVFADPPYNKGLVQKVITALAQSPLLNDGPLMTISVHCRKILSWYAAKLTAKQKLVLFVLQKYKNMLQCRKVWQIKG